MRNKYENLVGKPERKRPLGTPYIVREIKSRRLRWEGHMTRVVDVISA
jgi:hypothetical protein